MLKRGRAPADSRWGVQQLSVRRRKRSNPFGRLVSPLSALAASLSPGLAEAREARATSGSRLRRSLRACTTEGLVAEVFNACASGAVLTAWAVHLRVGTLL